jgi:hypothetical protein
MDQSHRDPFHATVYRRCDAILGRWMGGEQLSMPRPDNGLTIKRGAVAGWDSAVYSDVSAPGVRGADERTSGRLFQFRKKPLNRPGDSAV